MTSRILSLCAIALAACAPLNAPTQNSGMRLNRDYTIHQVPQCELITERNGYGAILRQYQQCKTRFVCTSRTGATIPCPRQTTAEIQADTDAAMLEMDKQECALYEQICRNNPNAYGCNTPPGKRNRVCGR